MSSKEEQSEEKDYNWLEVRREVNKFSEIRVKKGLKVEKRSGRLAETEDLK